MFLIIKNIFIKKYGNILTSFVKLGWELNNNNECILKWLDLEVKFVL